MARKRRASDDPDLLLTPLAPRAPRTRKGAPETIDQTPTEVIVHEEPADVRPPATAGAHGGSAGDSSVRVGDSNSSVRVAVVNAQTHSRPRRETGREVDFPRSSDLGGSLPEHSPFGGSSIERVIACPGSKALVDAMRLTGVDEEDPEYRRDGVQAHALAEHCLNTGQDPAEVMLLDPSFPDVTPQMADAVGVYVGYIRQRISEGFDVEIEQLNHRPEVHQLYYGKIDAWLWSGDAAELVDYKNGVGVVVEPAENPQLMHYVGLKVGMEPSPEYPDDMPIQLTIVQPNAYGLLPVRSWMTTAGFVRNWMRCVMVPAMRRAEANDGLDVGSHCRWCRGKLICPASQQLVATVAATVPDLVKLLPNENLRRLYERKVAVLAAVKAIDAEVERRLLAGVTSDELGAKLVEGKVDRVFKDDAPVVDTFGDAAYEPAKMRSPAQIEKLGDKGKAFVREWAHKPPGRPTVAPLDDKREAIKQADITTVFAAYTKGDSSNAGIDA